MAIEMAAAAPLRFKSVTARWAGPLIRAAYQPIEWDASTPFVDPIELKPGYFGLRAGGPVRPHTDPLFARWCYLFVLRAERAILKQHGRKDLRLKPGMLVEINSHRRHSLVQAPRDIIVWVPLDANERMPLDEALMQHRALLKTGTFVLHSADKVREIRSEEGRVVYDERMTWVYDHGGRCVARMGTDSYAICRSPHERTRVVPGGRASYLHISRREPHRKDWDFMVEAVRKAHGIAIPNCAMPRFIRDGVKAR